MTNKKKHPWKICPASSFYVKGHYKMINGKKRYWAAHCRESRNKKEILNFDEILEISKRFKNEKLNMPKSYDFNVKDNLGSKFDLLIAGWLQYWTDIFGNNSNITVDFVKVLIMTESSFQKNANAKIPNSTYWAIGLMQITDYTFKLIHENSKELKDHAFSINREDLYDPNVNISVGIRWLFRKREIAKYFLKKEPSPLELAEEYKGIRNDKSVKAQKQRRIFIENLKKYENSKKSK